ncbi:MAG TPA: heparinase II/III family protein, partial [Planctomycetota bacterium]|nr:heparinase II/III family protein [Planctomycetota bacterium]
TLFSAHQNWGWLGQEIRGKIESAFARIIGDVLPHSDKKHGAFKRKEDILAEANPLPALHNIPLIGTVGAALAAHVVKHPLEATFNQRVRSVLGALLDYRESGFTEGVAYDGYVLDFIIDWFAIIPESERNEFLKHPQMNRMLDESIMLSAPGNILEVAELSDVEPREMTFHASAQAKLNLYEPSAQRQWYLQRCDLAWLRADALGALFGEEFSSHPHAAPDAGCLDAHYARVLRSGWEKDDLAVCVAATNSGMGHMQCDGGTIVVGTAGEWLIADPGYQQYLVTSEREYSLGVGAHNAPVINGKAQTEKKPQVRSIPNQPAGTHAVEVELAACYPPELNLSSVRRTVWLRHDDLVVVADRISGASVSEIQYHWHSHRRAGWWTQDGMAKVALESAALWIASPQAQLTDAQIDRQRGSRGQMTLSVKIAPASVIWWVFSTDDAAPVIETVPTGLRVNGAEFSLPASR